MAQIAQRNCTRPGTPLSAEDAQRLVEGYIEHYNYVRMNSAVGYITPKDMLAGRQKEIHAEEGPEAGGRAKTAADSPAAGSVNNEARFTTDNLPACITLMGRPYDEGTSYQAGLRLRAGGAPPPANPITPPLRENRSDHDSEAVRGQEGPFREFCTLRSQLTPLPISSEVVTCVLG